MNLEITLIGLLVGYLSGLFGKGGSAIATPLLQLIGVPAFFAVASPLPAAVPGTLLAAYAYSRTGYIEKRVVLWGIAIGVPSTIVGSLLSPYIGGRNLLLASNILVMGMGLSFLAPNLFSRIGFQGLDRHHERNPNTEIPINAAIATVVGLISGALANAGGFLLAPLYKKILRLPLKSAFSCSLLVSAALAIPGTAAHMWLGHIDWKTVALFAIGSVPLSYVGAWTAIRMHPAKLESLFGCILTIIGIWGTIDLIRSTVP